MKIYLLSFILLVAALGAESASDEQGEEKLYVYDDLGNLVEVEYNESDASVPLSVDVNDVKFYLYPTPSVENELLLYDVESIVKSGFDVRNETIFVTHGWYNSKNNAACTKIRDALLKRGKSNVIIIDWSKIGEKLYRDAAHSVLSIGTRVAQMINFLRTFGLKFEKTTLIGHGEGAHVVGIAGYYSKHKVNYVVGLDPSRRFFNDKPPGERISNKDGKYVEIIHTNSGNNGFFDEIGEADFYVNGGVRQPNCDEDVGGSCSHARAYTYFAESLGTNMGFYGKQCFGSDISPEKCDGQLGFMGGLKRDLSERGAYYVHTHGVPPFAQGRP